MESTVEKNNSLVSVIETSGLELTTANSLKDAFMPFFEKADEWSQKAKQINITDATQVTEMKQAREARLMLRKIRVDADKKRKELKEDSLRYGKAVQGVYNVIEFLIAPIEEHLEKQEKFAEIKEKERKDALELERRELLSKFDVQFGFYDLRNMPEEDFKSLLIGSEKAFNEKREAEKRAEEKRIEDERKAREEQDRIKKENEALKKEAEERERVLAEERAKAEKEKREAEERARKEREALELKLRQEKDRAEKEAAKIKSEQEAKLKIEREERERVEAALKAKQEEERRAKELEAAKIEAELSKGDADKFNDLINELSALTQKYQFKSKKFQSAYSSGIELINKTIAYLMQKA